MAEEINGKEADFSVLTLRKPVIANGEEVSELKFREPTGGDIEKNGNPVLIDMTQDPPRITFDETKMAKMMAALATVPPSTIRQLHPKDWTNGSWQLARFFIPD